MIIDVSDPVYSFSEVMDRMDLGKHLAVKECRTGRPRYDAEKLLKIILFSFMENGYLSLRNIRKACKTDIRYLWLLPLSRHDRFLHPERNKTRSKEETEESA